MRRRIPLEIRWLVPILAVIVLLIVALWPRHAENEPTAGPGATTMERASDQGELDRLVAAAALQPCPSAPTSATAEVGVLGGIIARCLGSTTEVDLGVALSLNPPSR